MNWETSYTYAYSKIVGLQAGGDYVLKKDLNNDLHEIRTWLRSINDKIDTLILSR